MKSSQGIEYKDSRDFVEKIINKKIILNHNVKYYYIPYLYEDDKIYYEVYKDNKFFSKTVMHLSSFMKNSWYYKENKYDKILEELA